MNVYVKSEKYEKYYKNIFIEINVLEKLELHYLFLCIKRSHFSLIEDISDEAISKKQ